MRAALAILLLCLLSHQLFLKLGIIAWYEWNKDYVAQNLCENRDKPQLHCCGKCYLNKQLAKADASSNTDKSAWTQLAKLELSPYIIPTFFQLRLLFTEEAKAPAPYQSPFAEAVTLAVIHPPG